MDELLEKLYRYLYVNKCPSEVGLVEFTPEQGCPKGFNQDLQVCRNCWQLAVIKIEED